MGELSTLEDLEEAVDHGLPATEVLDLWDSEREKKNRKGALELIGDKLHQLLDDFRAENKALQKELEELESSDAPPLSTPPKADVETKKFMSLFNTDSIFLIAPLHEVERWDAMSKTTRYVVDLVGENVESLCRQFPHPYKELIDGTFRIATPSIRVAQVMENKIKNIARVREMNDIKITVHSLGTSSCVIKDAIRGKDVAIIREMCVISGKHLAIKKLVQDSDVKGLELNWTK